MLIFVQGGFGSLLRSFGKSILISKNKEACRDLNGRRMRDVNNEKKLKVSEHPIEHQTGRADRLDETPLI